MNGFRTSSTSPAAPGVGARIFASLFFCFFLGMGLVFAGLIVRESIRELRTWTWSKTPCEIGRSEVREGERRGHGTGQYYFDVQYRFNFGNRSYTSERYQWKPVGFQDYGKVARLTELYRPESTAVCYVNPSVPQESVLKRGNLLMPLVVLFPMIFVVIGFLGIYSMWQPKPAAVPRPQPISEEAIHPKGQGVSALFFAVFLLMGCALLYAFLIRPLIRIAIASKWPAVPCVVISSTVRSHSGSRGGTTYSVDILYRYDFDGREFKANRYDFMGGSSSGSSGKYAIIARYPPGGKATCFVNPADPTDAVLERGFTPMMWLGLLPLVFILVGVAGLAGRFRRSPTGVQMGRSAARWSLALAQPEVIPKTDPRTSNDPLVLKPALSPRGKVIGTFLVALFWNGVISVFVVHIIKGWGSGPIEWFLALFMVPFVLIGLGLLAAAAYFVLALFNPRPRLTITPAAIPLGGTFRVEWEISGRLDVLQHLRIHLEGREEATYPSGKNSATDTNLFADIQVAEETVAQAMRSGSSTVSVPAQSMHSFLGRHNKIAWVIRVRGEIARWPDINEEFPVTILPAAGKSAAAPREANEQPFGATT